MIEAVWHCIRLAQGSSKNSLTFAKYICKPVSISAMSRSNQVVMCPTVRCVGAFEAVEVDMCYLTRLESACHFVSDMISPPKPIKGAQQCTRATISVAFSIALRRVIGIAETDRPATGTGARTRQLCHNNGLTRTECIEVTGLPINRWKRLVQHDSVKPWQT